MSDTLLVALLAACGYAAGYLTRLAICRAHHRDAIFKHGRYPR